VQVGNTQGKKHRKRHATMAISRGHRVFAYGSGALGHLALHSRQRLHGRYTLSIEIPGYRTQKLKIRL
jgi:hypothetical protein